MNEGRHQDHPHQRGVDEHAKREAQTQHSHKRHVRGNQRGEGSDDITTAAVVTTRPMPAMPSAVLSSVAARASAVVGGVSRMACEASQYW